MIGYGDRTSTKTEDVELFTQKYLDLSQVGCMRIVFRQRLCKINKSVKTIGVQELFYKAVSSKIVIKCVPGVIKLHRIGCCDIFYTGMLIVKQMLFCLLNSTKRSDS